jgi:hypothetical protein
LAVALPTDIAPIAYNPSLIDFGGELTPILGGPVQRINRLGDRWAVEVTLPPLKGDEARIWISRLTHGRASSCLLPWPQPIGVGGEGAPRVNGAGQAGKLLSIDGLPAGKVLPEGVFLSIVGANRRYLHQLIAERTANGSGEVTLAIEPALRISPSDNAVVELAAPMIDGLVQGGVAWSVDLAREHGLTFTLVERE